MYTCVCIYIYIHIYLFIFPGAARDPHLGRDAGVAARKGTTGYIYIYIYIYIYEYIHTYIYAILCHYNLHTK